MKFLLGQKKQMTQVFADDGTVVPVTVIKAEPNVITAVRDQAKDGYQAVQLGAGVKREKRIAKPQRGQWKGLGSFRFVREVRLTDAAGLTAGTKMDVSQFQPGDDVE
ncbi:MAG: 50S ribosomal protein L3, partial [Candidatus Kerfeldbacteria bacterium]|nr:50S ribosomal protein L3 [Candidatus Kerfeldbacteria bacterium]